MNNRFHELDDAGITQYRSVEPLSVLSVLLAIGSVGAFFNPWIASPFFLSAIVFSLISLFRIKGRPETFVGRKAALFSLGLALFCASGGIIRYVTHEYMIRQRAKTVGQEFLELIAHDQPELAFQWLLSSKKRCGADANIWTFYRSDGEFGENLRKFTSRKDIRALLALGPDAKIYPVGRSKYNNYPDTEAVNQVYAIDFKSDDDKTKTFFFKLLIHYGKSKEGTPQWIISDYRGGIDPWNDKK